MPEINYYPTKHLLENMSKRNVSLDEVMDVIRNAENRYGPDAQGRTNHQKGNLCVVTYANGGILTVLLKQEGQWTDEVMAARQRKAPIKYCDFHECPGYQETFPIHFFALHRNQCFHVRCEMRYDRERRNRA